MDSPEKTHVWQAEGLTMKTGQPISVPYLRRKSSIKTAHYGEQFGQHVEPSGEYMAYHKPSWGYPEDRLEGGALGKTWFEHGTVHFKNPIVVSGQNTREWKENLSAAHGGRKNKVLTKHLAKIGHDGVIATAPDGQIHEMVNISAPKEQTKTLPPEAIMRTSMKKFEEDLISFLSKSLEVSHLQERDDIDEDPNAEEVKGITPFEVLRNSMSK